MYLVVSQHRPLNMGKKDDILFIFAALQVLLAQQNYNVKEGDVVDITLETSTSDYMFDFTITLQLMDGTATGESFYLSTQNRNIYGYRIDWLLGASAL